MMRTSTRLRAGWLLGLLGLLSMAVPPGQEASAQFAADSRLADSRGPTPWRALSPAQQTALQPLHDEWHSISAAQRAKWVEVANRLPSLPPTEQARIQGRMAAWALLSPTERGQTRFNYRAAQQLSPEQRKARWEAYKALSEEQRQELAVRASPTRAPWPDSRSRREPSTPAKQNLVPTQPPPRPMAVAPSVGQARPGASTILVTRKLLTPAHQPGGSPKVVTSTSLLDHDTLLPKRRERGQPASAAAPASAP